MLLEDFFTLAEMKDGLATLARVEELVSVMQKHKDYDSNNSADVARQWATVASTLTATEKSVCLNHFLQLDGLIFLNCWLQEAQKWNDNTSDCSVEELINGLLTALCSLPLDKEKISTSGIRSTIKQLLGHSSHSIQEHVKALMNKWSLMEDSDDAEMHSLSCHDELKHSSKTSSGVENVASINAGLDVSSFVANPATSAQINSNSSLTGKINDMNHPSDKMSHHHDLASSDMNEVSREKSYVHCQDRPEGMVSSWTHESSVSRGRDPDDRSDGSCRKNASDILKEEIDVNMEGCRPCKIVTKDASLREDDIGMVASFMELERDHKSKLKKEAGCMTSYVSLKPAICSDIGETAKRSEIGLGYSEIDALEVARQVAIEVEREVVDYREAFCSSPEGMSRDKSVESNSPGISESNYEKPLMKQQKDGESYGMKTTSENSTGSTKRTSNSVESKDTLEPESPQSSLVEESPVNACRNILEFDLNEDICLEEAGSPVALASNHSSKVSAPIPVSASKGTPSFPVNPLHFQGVNGWKGSAATSAFRPASPWKNSDGETTVSGPKQKPNFLKIDLNVTEGEDDVAADQFDKQTPVSSSIRSRESSMEVSSRQAELLKFDLNRKRDDDTSNQVPFWKPYVYNPGLCSSPASSSSSRQPSARDFDLNDNPSSFHPSGSNSHSQISKATSTHGSYMIADSAVRIMGSRIPVERKMFLHEASHSFVAGVDPAVNFKGPVSYPPMPSSAFGYNGLLMGPAISIPPNFCGPGPVPYFVDSRGATIVPQMVGSIDLTSVYPARAPHIMTLAGSPSGLNISGVPRPSLDLNSGSIPSEGVGRTAGSFKQFLVQGNSGLMEEEMRSAAQPGGSGVALKRKEPDCGWEPCAFGYKQVTSWQ